MYSIQNNEDILSMEYSRIQSLNDIAALIKKAKISNLAAVYVETTGPDPFLDEISSIWISTGAHEPVAIIQMDQVPRMISRKLKGIFASRSIEKIFFNAVKVYPFLVREGFIISGAKFDALTAHNILNFGFSIKKFGIDELIRIYLDEYYDDLPSFEADLRPDDYLNTLAACVNLLFPLREVLMNNLSTAKLNQTAELEFGCIDAACKLNLTGIKIDKNYLRRIRRQLERECCRCRDEAQPYFPEDFNIDGRSTLMQELNNHPTVQRENFVFENTKRETLELATERFPFIRSISEYRSTKHKLNIISSMLDSIKRETGRVHALYTPLLNLDGGFSCMAPPLKWVYPSQELREGLIADGNNILITGGYRHLWLRVVAQLSGDGKIIEKEKKNVDFVKDTASIFFGKHSCKISQKEIDFMESLIKKFIFGNIESDLSKQELDFKIKFFNRYQKLFKWKDTLIRSEGDVNRTLGGRVRQWDKTSVFRKGLLTSVIQGSVSDVSKRALWNFSEKRYLPQAYLVGFLNNNILVETDKESADYIVEELSASLKEAYRFYLHDVPVKINVRIQSTHGDI